MPPGKDSEGKAVAKVKKGNVTAQREGTATITATYKKKKYTCTVTVTEPGPLYDSADMLEGETYAIEMKGGVKITKCKSSDKNVASVKDGVPGSKIFEPGTPSFRVKNAEASGIMTFVIFKGVF